MTVKCRKVKQMAARPRRENDVRCNTKCKVYRRVHPHRHAVMARRRG